MSSQAAIGIVRVSQMRGREEASIPDQQRRIAEAAQREGLELIDLIEERDVPGSTPLGRRKGLRGAIEAVEAGRADTIIVAYFDRLVRSLRIQGEILQRVENAGGRVLAVDFGEVSGKTSTQWLAASQIGLINEFHGKVLAERVGAAQAAAVARGVAPWSNTVPGYTRNADGIHVPNEKAPIMREAFKLRAQGKSFAEVRRFLSEHGIRRGVAGVRNLLHNRVYLGEIHFGDLHNLKAHEPIVEPEMLNAAQRAEAPRGRKPKSKLLLARLGVLRCATCGSRLVAGTANHGTTPTYRCRNLDCKHRVTISANVVEPIVVEAVQTALRRVEGRASAEFGVRDGERRLERAQAALDKAIGMLEDFMDEPMAVNKIRKLQEERDAARERVEQLGGKQAAIVLRADRAWGRLSLDGRRDLIRAVIERASVAPGSGTDRVTIELVGQ